MVKKVLIDRGGHVTATALRCHGIGLSTAQLLVDRGAQVLVTGRSPGPIHTAQEQLGPQAHLVAYALFGLGTQVELIFVNARYAALEPLNAVTEDSFRRTFDTNVFGPFFAAQKLTPILKDGGAMVFTTSVVNQLGIPGMATYATAKAAVQSLVQTLAAELMGCRIRVNAVSPGFVRTPTMGVANTSADDRTTFVGEGVALTRLERIGNPEEIARAVVFLGFEATFTTGSQVVLDGGLESLQVH
ncbi:hypothetical protein N8T08_009968 [Aspergillus melleus]|uniref:Uncharacterized protein n=1 Tax=Aspergillus melleus TaxID=138277 RepID=A0ACC3AS90_9EURO|nr:hypothetical protein N8T08_009968 [Aspergillus melleus]